MTQKYRKKYVLTLLRQRIIFSGKGGYDSAENNDEHMEDEEGKRYFLSTDYFDRVIAERVDESTDIGIFSGIKECAQEYSVGSNIIAVRNYSVFRDVDTESQGEELDLLFFDKKEQEPYEGELYLGLIHVYVTIDVLANLDEEKFPENSEDYMCLFERDLQKILGDCGKRSAVFRMLSGSDFMIVVRSNDQKDVLSVARAIRKRMIFPQTPEGDRGPNEENGLHVYKTYTILTRTRDVNDSDRCNINDEDHVVIRVRYSHEYWSRKRTGMLGFIEPESIGCLYGRYDFETKLKLGDYLEVHELWKEAKKKGEIKNFKLPAKFKKKEKNDKQDERNKEINEYEGLRYLYDLIKNGCISYLNERYLLKNEKDSCADSQSKKEENEKRYEVIDGLFLKKGFCKENMIYRYDANNRRCAVIIGLINEVRVCLQYIGMKTLSMEYQLKLIENLVYVCQNINALSDARIYVPSLLKHIEVVLKSLKKWMELYREAERIGVDTRETGRLSDFAERYLHSAVASLEEYGSLIRSDNFQTLQAPRYSAIAGIGMEKMLVGYSKFLDVVMEFCCNELDEMNKEKRRKKYVPLMISGIGKRDLSVEVLFPERTVFSEDGKLINNCVKDTDNMYLEYLMTARSPISRITEVKYTINTLFHEMAHSLRYEKRSVRNDVLLSLMIEDIVNELNQNFFTVLVDMDTGIDNTTNMQKRFVDVIREKLRGSLKKLSKEPYADLCLEDFKYEAQKHIQKWIELLTVDRNEVLIQAQNLIDNSNEYLTGEAIEIAGELAQAIDEFTGQQILKKTYNKRFKAFEKQRKENRKELEKGIRRRIVDAIDLYVNWFRKNVEEEVAKNVSSLGEALKRNVMRAKVIYYDDIETINGFYNEVYESLCQKWRELLGDYSVKRTTEKDKAKKYLRNTVLPEQKEWLKIGRKLGIDKDTDSNKRIFKEYLTKSIKLLKAYSMSGSMDIINQYREETADMFMCSMCELNFTTYLAICEHMFAKENGTEDEGNIERLTDVMLMQWGVEDEKIILVNSDRELDCSILCRRNLFGGLLDKLGCTPDEFPTDVASMKKYLESHIVSGGEKARNASIAIRVINKIADRVSLFVEHDYIFKDFLRGKEVHDGLKERFKEEGKKNKSIGKIIEICRICHEVLSVSEDSINDNLRELYNHSCEDFFLYNLNQVKIKEGRCSYDKGITC